MSSLDSDKLRLTDFMDLPTLQEIQDSFAAVANVKATITDADGNLLTQPTPTREFLRRQSALAADEEKLTAQGGPAPEGPQKEGAEYVAPIIVNNQRLGTIRMTANGADAESKEGRLLIFPAWVKHTVPANDGQSDRISISFNLMFANFTETMASPMWDATAGKEKA